MICKVCGNDHEQASAFKFRACWVKAGQNPGAPVPVRKGDCKHLGELLTADEKKAKGLPPFKRFGKCGLGLAPQTDNYVCPDCGKCKKCPSYDGGDGLVQIEYKGNKTEQPKRETSTVGEKAWDSSIFQKDPLASFPPVKKQDSGKDAIVNIHTTFLNRMASRDYGKPECSRPRGIITCGGGAYWPGVVVLCKMTREYDKDIPIQVWYRGKSETVSKEDVEGLGVELIDIDHMIDILGDARLMGGWESKLYAITHTDFKVVAYLDADAYPVDNLSRMCDIAENDGFAFWQDTGGCENNVKWRKAMGSERPPNAIKAIQGGQLFINREKCWNEIVVAHWMNQHSDYFYQHMYGDQDTWRVAFTLTGKKYANLGNARLADGVFDCQYGGKSYVVHRCQWKMFHLKDIPTGKTRYAQSRHGSLPKEKEAFGHFVEYINKVDKDPAKSFENVYRKRLWGKGSGRGSTPEEGKPYADIINRMMREHGWFDVVDAGCGEGVFCEWLEFGGYTGVDVWPEMIKRNRRKYPEHSWSSGDIADINNLSSGDVLLVKDVLMHWPNEKIRQFLADAIASKKWDAILCTQDNGQVFDGQDTFLGGWRPLNPEMAPLNEFKPVVVAEYLYKSILLFECQ